MPASPKAGTPTSVSSPVSLAPAPPTNTSSLSVPGSPSTSPHGPPGLPFVTRKEWVLPPRPKPGRKPATDTPPTKRKAQNRAAQRAFRERRASKVGELEEHIKQIEEEDEREQTELREHISKLEADVEYFRDKVEEWANRAKELEREMMTERAEKEQLRDELRVSRQCGREENDIVPLSPRKPEPQEEAFKSQRYPNEGPSSNLQVEEEEVTGCGRCTLDSRCECMEQALKIETMGCGKCSLDTRCECLEQATKMTDIAWSGGVPASNTKRPHSPPQVVTNKRHQDSRAQIDAEQLETDFTAMFASNKTSNRFSLDDSPETASPTMDRDPCGFCSDGSHCVCAELEKEATIIDEQTRLRPILSHITPPPSDGDVQCSNSKPEPLYPSIRRSVVPSDPCANGPGTCAQCQKDPQSTLFCKSLAVMRGSNSDPDDACCGLPGATNGCCRAQAPIQTSNPQPLNKPLLSCADAYTTLSRHPRYSEASEEPGTWLGRLNTTPPRSGIEEGRPSMEVEAASVMGVLKLFDRRFGRG
ncbi:MAG: hypothetical protein M1835_002181 [Candelina submexicana]|nr:MAG: hypothetical protein M1835_002181 [Candelina submexicana]